MNVGLVGLGIEILETGDQMPDPTRWRGFKMGPNQPSPALGDRAVATIRLLVLSAVDLERVG